MYIELPAPEHVIAMHLSGKLTGEDMQAYTSILDKKLSSQNQIGVLVDFTGLADMNADAFIEGTKADLDFLNHIDQFSCLSLVSDKEWPQAMGGFMSSIFPTVEMKVFTHGESDEALKWASELPKARKP